MTNNLRLVQLTQHIQPVLTDFLLLPGIESENTELILNALVLAERQNVDFADAILALQAAKTGCQVCTFDTNDFKKLPVKWCIPS